MPLDFSIPPVQCAFVPYVVGATEMVSIPVWIEMVAVVAAAISGVLTAREKKLDLLGAMFLAAVCALGGGLLRDMILQVGNVYILKQPLALPTALTTAAIVFVIPTFVAKQDRLIAILDIFAVGLFAATGADKALVYGFEPLIGIVMGFFTAVGGGMLRDICLGQVPYIFQRSNFYAVAAIAGAAVYTFMVEADMSHTLAVVACVAITMGLRYVSLRFNIMSPADIDLAQAVPNALHKTPLRRITRSRDERETVREGRSGASRLMGLRSRNLATIARREEEEARRRADAPVDPTERETPSRDTPEIKEASPEAASFPWSRDLTELDIHVASDGDD